MPQLVRFNITPDETGEIKVKFSTHEVDLDASFTWGSPNFVGLDGKTGDAEIIVCEAAQTFVINKEMFINTSANFNLEDAVSDGRGEGIYKLFTLNGNYILTAQVTPGSAAGTGQLIAAASDPTLFNVDLNGYTLLGEIKCSAGRQSVQVPVCVFTKLDPATSGFSAQYGEVCFATNYTSGRKFRIGGFNLTQSQYSPAAWWSLFTVTAKTYYPKVGIVPGANVVINQFREEVTSIINDLRDETTELAEELRAAQAALINTVQNTFISR